MPIKKVVNGFLSLAVLAVFLWQNESLMDFVLWASIVVVATFCFDLWLSRRVRQSGQETFFPSLLPCLYLIGLFGTLSAVSSPATGLLLALGGSAFFYLFQNHFPTRPPHNLEEMFVLVSAIFTLTFVWSLSFYYLFSWYKVLFVCAVMFFVFADFLARRGGLAGRKRLLFALVCALIMAETGWAVLFWPSYFLTVSAVHFVVFYLLYFFSVLYFDGRLTRKQSLFHSVLSAAVIFLILLSSPWRPVR